MSSVYSVTISIDSKYVVSGSRDCSIRVWSLHKKCQEAVLQGHTSHVYSVVITNDNRYIVSGC